MTVRPETKPVSRESPSMLPADEELLVDREHDFSPSRSAIPLPVPPPPPKLDPSIALVSHEESVSASASDRPAESKDKITLSPQNRKKLPLSSNSKDGDSGSTKPTGELPSMVSVVGATGLVLGIFLLLAWIVRRKTPQAMHRLPGEAFEILGRAPLSGRQQVHLLRCGARLLLVSVTPAGAETLTEITDPAEVDRLAGLCRQAQPGSSSAAFKQIFEQLAPKRPGKGESMFHDEAERELSAAGYYRGRAWEDRHA
jgi:flagellar biogenesis protein FliO